MKSPVTMSDLRIASPSSAGRQRLLSLPREPLLIAGWRDVVMLHFAVDAVALQREVPFAVERFEGQAFVSLVCFTLRDMRPRWGGALGAVMLRPVGMHRYLNVRTYVRHGDQPGIFFLAEWLSSRLATWFGPQLFGLPFRYGHIDYLHGDAAEGLRGCVRAVEGELAYQGHPTARDAARPTSSAPGSLDEFLLERYTAFTTRSGRQGFFRVWHPAWVARRVDCEVTGRSLLTANWPWLGPAELVGAHHSRGFDEVWMGWPHRLTAGADSTS